VVTSGGETPHTVTASCRAAQLKTRAHTTPLRQRSRGGCLQVPYKVAKLTTSWGTTSFSRRRLPHSECGACVYDGRTEHTTTTGVIYSVAKRSLAAVSPSIVRGRREPHREQEPVPCRPASAILHKTFPSRDHDSPIPQPITNRRNQTSAVCDIDLSRGMVTISTAYLNTHNTVYLCFERFSQQTATVSPHSINRLCSVAET
jgi:hypothetical protein